MKNKYANNISRREYNKTDCETYLVRNYATRIRNYAQVNMYAANLESIFHNVFGNDWYKNASFSQLCSIAKMAKKYRNSDREYKPETLVPLSQKVLTSCTKELLGANSYVNAFAKIYGKKAKEDLLARTTIYEYTCDGRGVSNVSEILTWVRDALRYAQFIKQYAPKEYAKLKKMKNYTTICDNQWELRDSSIAVRNEEMLYVMPDDLREEWYQDSAKYMVKIMLGDATTCDRLQAKLRNMMSADAYRIAHYGVRAREYNVNKLMKHLREYRKAKDFARLLEELDLLAPRDSYLGCLNRVNNKVYSAMKSVAKMDVDIAAKQKTVCDIAKREDMYSRSRTVWSPRLIANAKGEK